jgi:DNA-binding CsgD family transcriptional regulator
MLERLSDSDRRVVDLVVRGFTNREVADQLRLSHKTVEWTLTNVYSKFAVRSRTELAAQLARDFSLREEGDCRRVRHVPGHGRRQL